MNVIWRPYQEQCFDIVKEKWKKEGINKQLIVAATGLGKRLMAVNISAWPEFKRVLFLVHREELMIQAYDDFQKFFPMDVGIVKAETFEIDKKITIASVQTIHRRLEKIPPKYYDLMISDEAHHFVAETFVKPHDHFTPRLSLGFTATPHRLDNLDLKYIFDEITYQYDIAAGVKDNWLCELDAVRVQTQIDISQIKRVAGDFNQKELSLVVDTPERNQLIINKYKHYANNRQAIAFCVNVKHAENLRDLFIENGISAATISYETNPADRRQYIEDFKNGKIKILTNVDILTEGFDYSDVGCILLCRPTQSLTLYIQMIGRGTRMKSFEFILATNAHEYLKKTERFPVDIDDLTYVNNGKRYFYNINSETISALEKQFLRTVRNFNNCKILDFVDNHGKHKIVNTWTLDQHKQFEDKVFMTSEKRDEYIRQRDEKNERIATIKSTFKKDKKIDLLSVPEVSVYNSPRMKEPATEKQIEFIKNIGLYQEGIIYTKYHASQLITNKPAEEWMIRIMVKWGYDASEDSTYGEYYNLKKIMDDDIMARQPISI